MLIGIKMVSGDLSQRSMEKGMEGMEKISESDLERDSKSWLVKKHLWMLHPAEGISESRKNCSMMPFFFPLRTPVPHY